MTDPWLGPNMPPPDPRWPDNPEPLQATPRDSWSPRQVDVPGVVASVLIILTTIASAAVAWADWRVHDAIRGYYFGQPITEADLDAADGLAILTGWVYTGTVVAAAIAFIVWLWRARQNAERISTGEHTRARGWAIGSWFVPIVAYWFPYQVVRDVWRASNPLTRVTLGALSQVKGAGLLPWWWLAFLVSTLAGQYSFRLSRGDDPTTQEGWLRYFEQVATADTVSAVADVFAAALIVVVIRQVSGWQTAAVQRRAPAGQ